jgi:hypothetical protein
VASVPFRTSVLPEELKGQWSPFKLLDRATLLATVSRLTRKWRKLRDEVFARVPRDTLDMHRRGQMHMFWAARVNDAFEFKDTKEKVSALPMSEQEKLAYAYISRRLRWARQGARDGGGNDLARVQSEALLSFLEGFSPTPAQIPILATSEQLRRDGIHISHKPLVSRTWVGGVPTPTAIVEEKSPSSLWKEARTLAGRQAALEEDAPYQSTDVCRFEGRLERPSGSRPQKFVLPGGPPLQYLIEERPDLLKHLGPSDCSAAGAWDTSKASFEAMITPVRPSAGSADLHRALYHGWSSLRLGRVPAPSVRALDCVRVNGRAFPGIVSSDVGKSRKEVFAAAAEIAKFHYRMCSERFVPDCSLWGCGGREKPCQGVSPGDPLKSRLVLMPETPSAILESAFSQPLTEMLKRVKGDICIGRVMTNRGFQEVIGPLKDFDHVKAFDWSGFDTRVTERLIVAAFGVMRACFYGDDESLDNIFLRFLSHFLVKRVVVPGGWVYTVAQGVPSGSPFTSIVDSIVNWLVLVDLEITFGGVSAPSRCVRRVYGDDFLQAWGVDAPDKHQFISVAKKRWGFVAKERAAFEGNFATTDVELALPFLSYRFPCGLPARPVADALKIALLPKKPRDSLSAQFARVIYLDHFSPFDAELTRYHSGYFRWVQERMPGWWHHGAFRGNPDIVRPWIRKAMVNYVADGFAEGIVSLGDWFRQEDPRRWPERWCPRHVARDVGVTPPRPGKLLSALAHLKWGDFG